MVQSSLCVDLLEERGHPLLELEDDEEEEPVE